MNDSISRQAVINMLVEMQGLCTSKEALIQNSKIWQQIKDFPSTQPEIIHCKECKYAYMTANGECEYCDIWFPDERLYLSGDYFCGSGKRKGEQNG